MPPASDEPQRMWCIWASYEAATAMTPRITAKAPNSATITIRPRPGQMRVRTPKIRAAAPWTANVHQLRVTMSNIFLLLIVAVAALALVYVGDAQEVRPVSPDATGQLRYGCLCMT